MGLILRPMASFRRGLTGLNVQFCKITPAEELRIGWARGYCWVQMRADGSLRSGNGDVKWVIPRGIWRAILQDLMMD